MTKKETLKWRLSKLPTSEEVLKLVNDKIITKEEGREILFSTEIEEERSEESLKSEIKFLREIIEKLSSNQSTKVVEVIKEVYKPYYRFDWYQPYMVYCNAGTSTTYSLSGSGSTDGGIQLTANTTAGAAQTDYTFTAIKTF